MLFDEQDNRINVVGALVRKRRRHGRVQHLVQWEDLPESKNAWEGVTLDVAVRRLSPSSTLGNTCLSGGDCSIYQHDSEPMVFIIAMVCGASTTDR